MIRRVIHTFTQKRDLTAGSISKNIWILALPMIVSNLLQTALNLVDMAWVGRLGPASLAAVAMSSSVVFVVMSVFIGLGTGTIALVSRAVGGRDYNRASYVAVQSFIAGTIAGAVLGIFGLFFSGQCLRWLGADQELLFLGAPYLQVILAASIVFIYLALVNIVLQAAGDAFTPMVIMVLVTVLNIVLDPLMIFGLWGFPRWGITGAAIATVLAEVVGILIGFEVLFRGRSRLKFSLAYLKFDWPLVGEIIAIGVPASLQLALRSVMGVVFMAIVAAFGVPALAAYGVGLRLNMIVMMPGFGLANAAATLVGQNLGAGNPRRASQSAWLAAGYYMLIMLALSMLFIVFAPYWILIFNHAPEVVGIGADFMRITSTTFIFVALGLVLGRAQAGAGDTLPPMVITLITLWGIQVPLALVLAYAFGLGLKGVWYAIAIAPVIGGMLNVIWFQMGKWQP